MNKKNFLYLIAAVWLSGCTPSVKKAAEHRLNHSAVYENELIIGHCVALVATPTHLIGVDVLQNDHPFFAQNITDTASFFHFGTKGQGAEGFILPFSLQLLDNGQMLVYDIADKTINRLYLDLNTRQCRVVRRQPDEKQCFTLLLNAWEQYLGTGPFTDGMFALLDSTGLRTHTFLEYPCKDQTEKNISNAIRAMAYQGKIKTNTSRTKLAYAAHYADILYFCDLRANDLTLIRKIENNFCQYTADEQNDLTSASIMPENANSCADLYATDQYVYLLYSGKTFREYGEKALETHQLRIYNWQGELLRDVMLDLPCKNLCVSADDATLWAITEMPDPKLVAYDLRGLLNGVKP
jgi:hypothetical protein